MRAFYQERPSDDIRYWAPADPRSRSKIAHSLAELGLLEHRFDSGGQAWWRTTITGNALAQVSFRLPIRRATAERHLAAVIERAAQFNADRQHLATSTNLRCLAAT